MAKRIPVVFLLLLPALLATTAQAQRRKAKAPQARPTAPAPRNDTSIKSTTLEVIQVYQPEMKPLQKPVYPPSLPPADSKPQAQHYEVPQQTLLYSYRALPLRPLALGKDTGALPPQRYVLLGGGNLSTALAELGWGGLQGKDWKANIFGRYLTQEGSITNQIYRNFLLRGDAEWQKGNHLLDAGLDLDRHVYGRYGYDHSLWQFSKDDVRMKYDAATLRLGLRNVEPGPWDIFYSPTLSAGIWDGRQGHENNLKLYAPVRRSLDSSWSVGLALNAQLFWNSLAQSWVRNQNSSLFQLTPFVDFQQGGMQAHLALSPTWSSGASLLWLPDVRLTTKAWDGRVHIELSGKSERLQNTPEQLCTQNPYFFPGNFSIHQTTRSEGAAQVQVVLGKHMTVWGRASWLKWDDAPLFVTLAGSDGKDFSIIYEHEIQAFGWGGGLRYQVGEYFSLGAEGQWRNYYRQTMLPHPYGMPGVKLRGNLSWRLVRGLLLTSYAEVWDEIWGLDAAGNSVRQKGVFDFGAAAEYSIVSKLSVFLRAENILGRQNERWLGYPSFGFNLYGGLRYRF